MKLVNRKELEVSLSSHEMELIKKGFEVVSAPIHAIGLYKKDDTFIKVFSEENVLYVAEYTTGEGEVDKTTDEETETIKLDLTPFKIFEKSLEGLNGLQRNAALKTKYKELGGTLNLSKSFELAEGIKTLLS